VLKKSAEERYPTMQDMVNALKTILATPQVEIEQSIRTEDGLAASPSQARTSEQAESAEGLFGSFRKLFGRKNKAEKKASDTANRTAPQPQLDIFEADDEAFDSTMQLNLRNYSPESQPHLVLQDKNIIINLPDRDVIFVGRTYRNNVVDLDLEPHEASKYGVSRRHARFMRQGDLWLLEDLGSLNGTFVNNAEVKQGKPVVLKDGDHVRFSHMAFIFMRS
jgi:hypothetical protein